MIWGYFWERGRFFIVLLFVWFLKILGRLVGGFKVGMSVIRFVC